MKLILLFLMLVGLVLSCTNLRLNTDLSEPATTSNFHSLELSCDTHEIGIAGCAYQKDQDTLGQSFKVYVLQSGELKIFSNNCGIDLVKTYTENGWQTIEFSEILGSRFSQSCLISLLFVPKYPGQDRATLKIHNFKGQVYVKVYAEDSEPAKIGLHKGVYPVKERIGSATPELIRVDLQGSLKGVYKLQGCNQSMEGSYNGAQSLEFNTAELVSKFKDCIVQGAIVPFDKPKDFVLSFVVETFDQGYSLLAVPDVQIGKKKTIITGSTEVSFTDVNGRVFNSNKAKIKNADKLEIRQYTVKGRYIYGKYEDGKWTWKQ
jgi:hypothetical protein